MDVDVDVDVDVGVDLGVVGAFWAHLRRAARAASAAADGDALVPVGDLGVFPVAAAFVFLGLTCW